MNRQIIVGIALSGAILAGSAAYITSPTAARAATLSSLVLTKKDVPPGYKQSAAGTRTIQNAASSDKVSVATLRAKGWVGDYEADFSKGTGTNVRQINSSVAQFKSASGATWDLNNGLQLVKKEFPKRSTFAVRGIGQQAVGIKITGKAGTISYTIIFVAFREGSFVGSSGVTGEGKSTTPSTSEALAYARIIDSRLKHA